MIELSIRLVLSAILAIGGYQFDLPPGDWGWQIGAVIAAYSIFGYLLEKRGMRNAGTAALMALTDAAAIALVASTLDQVGNFGFLVLAPLAYATATFGANAAAMSPIAASVVVASANFGPSVPNLYALLGQAVSIMLIGILLHQGKVVMTITERVEVPRTIVKHAAEPIQFYAMRENFRKMRDHCEVLERKSRRSRIVAALTQAIFDSDEDFMAQIAQRLKTITGVEGVAIYTCAKLADTLVVRGVAGEIPRQLETESFDISNAMTDGLIRKRMNQLMEALRETNSSINRGVSVVLRDQGKLLGVVCLSDPAPDRLQKASEMVEDAVATICGLFRKFNSDDATRRKLHVTELLYHLAGIVAGATTSSQAADRVVRDAWPLLSLDHFSVSFLDGSEPLLVAREGAAAHPMNLLTLSSGQGIEGWLASNAPEIHVFDSASDDRCARNLALKSRVGSFHIVPIQFAEKPYGFLAASTHRMGGIDAMEVENLRMIADELGQAIGRIEDHAREAMGLMTPREFYAEVETRKEGCFIVLEPVRREALVSEFGAIAFDRALRKYGAHIRARLPIGAIMCRRSEEDFLIFLPSAEEAYAQSWANNAVAQASLTSFTTPDGRHRIPLGMKARTSGRTVAKLTA